MDEFAKNPDFIDFTDNFILLGKEPARGRGEKRVQTHLQSCMTFPNLGFTTYEFS